MQNNRFQQYRPTTADSGEEEQSNQFMQFVQPTLEKFGDTIANTVRKQPLAGIAAGLTIGVILGCFIKRR